MAKKLILLLLLIPIVVMILLFAATQAVSNLVEVPPTDLDIINEQSIVYLDMDKNETFTIEYAVYPTTAQNKEISVSTETYENEPLADFDYKMEDGKVTITPTRAGAAKVILSTHIGGHRDNILVYVESTRVQEINATVEKNELMVGETIRVNTTFVPTEPANKNVTFISSNPNVASVGKYTGVVTALRKGVTTITAISEEDPNITSSVQILVKNKDVMDIPSYSAIYKSEGSIPVSMDTQEAFTVADFTYQIFDESGNPVPASAIEAWFEVEGEVVTFRYRFLDKAFVGKVTVKMTFGTGVSAMTQTCTINKVPEVEVVFDHEGAYGVFEGQNVRLSYLFTPEDAAEDFVCEVFTSNDNITAEIKNGGLAVSAKKAGVTKITLIATSTDGSNQQKTVEIDVVVQPKNAAIDESVKELGIENRLAVGGYEYGANNTLVLSASGNRATALHFATSSAMGEGFAENFKWHSSTEKVLISENGVISFADDGEIFNGEVQFWAEFSYGGIATKTASFTVLCVEDGVNVYTYADLHYATQAELPVVLQNDIGNEVVDANGNTTRDFGYINGELTYAGEIDTTYDTTFYKNVGEENNTKVKVLVNFKNNVYGNGYTINAHNVTYKFKTDSNGEYVRDTAGYKIWDEENALFKGPLSFVQMRELDATTSVSAQDNICFAIYDNVTVSNVKLRGCDLEADEDGNQDLIDLNKVGTTVEVLGDNVTIAYSRVNNGRTVIRVFGILGNPDAPIHLNIFNSELGGAREFILRIGSNRVVNGKDGNISPNLPGDTGKAYESKKEYYSFTEAQKAQYDEKYINTYVTVKNCILKDTAILAIGMDSHFAGILLHDGPTNASSEGFGILTPFIEGWKGLAKTSYGAKLYFEGEVGLYNWKDLKQINSTSLIEINGVSAYKDYLDFNIQALVDEAADPQKHPENQNIITKHNGADYVHAGIVFFGGGKNYSVFDSDSNIVGELGRYEISFGDAGKAYLDAAAGNKPFYFFIYDRTSAFTPQTQQDKLDSGEAYDCLYRK